MQDIDKTHWDAYLLDPTKLEKVRSQGKLLRTMKHEDISQLAAIGPVEVMGFDDYAARKALYSALEKLSWFKPTKGGFTALLPFIYVRNKVDNRIKDGVDIKALIKKAKKEEQK